MHYMPKEREDIGKRVFTHEITKKEAAEEYGVSEQSIVNYVREYMRASKIPVVPDADDAISIDMPDYAEMTKEQLISVIMRKDIEVARAKKGYTVKKGRWKGQGILFYKRCEYQIAIELSARWPIKSLCEAMSISRSGYYKWKSRLLNP